MTSNLSRPPSSHREAPEIAKDPIADSSDLVRVRQSRPPGHRHADRRLRAGATTSGGPNFFEFGDDVRYEIHIDNDATVIRSSPIGLNSPPRSRIRTAFFTTPGRSRARRAELELSKGRRRRGEHPAAGGRRAHRAVGGPDAHPGRGGGHGPAGAQRGRRDRTVSGDFPFLGTPYDGFTNPPAAAES
ncbi:DUF4331 family protein [Micromonospora sp. MP36]|uniref:DUF4331 family protein n=1 Tax=Micromonospora sp. MP36 TaxID=2604468 RepID=UPI00351BAA72